MTIDWFENQWNEIECYELAAESELTNDLCALPSTIEMKEFSPSKIENFSCFLPP